MSMGWFPKKMHFLTLKDSLKFKLLAFRKKYIPFVDKMHLLKGAKKFGQGPPPLIRAMPKRMDFFLWKPSL